jgi:C1A family cysteine protease
MFHERLANLLDIKRALTQHLPVVLGVRTDNPFYDGTDTSVYRWSGEANSGFHAICAVGYDDSKSSVKLMNSWGDS